LKLGANRKRKIWGGGKKRTLPGKKSFKKKGREVIKKGFGHGEKKDCEL